VRLLELTDGGYRINDQPVDEYTIDWTMFGVGDTLICEYVQQGRFAGELNPRTVNTIRAITMFDPAEGRPFIAAAALRIGTTESFPVDNIGAGGVFCNIDLATGTLHKVIIDFFRGVRPRSASRHPETGAVCEGKTIPDWPRVSAEIVSLASRLPILPYIAWDVALLDRGISIIEGNQWGDLAWFQIERPLLADDRIRRFLRHHSVL
jgi:hypothetical protein